MAWCKIDVKTDLFHPSDQSPSLEMIIRCQSSDFAYLQELVRGWLTEFDKSVTERYKERDRKEIERREKEKQSSD